MARRTRARRGKGGCVLTGRCASVTHAKPMRSAVGRWHAAPQQRRAANGAARLARARAPACVRARMRANVTCDRRVYVCVRACLTRRASERAHACARGRCAASGSCRLARENRSAASLYWKDNVRTSRRLRKGAHRPSESHLRARTAPVCLFPLFVAHAPMHSACRSSRRQWASATQRVRQDRLATSGQMCSPKPHALAGLPYGSLCAPE